jgi:hypothetical protein
MELYRAKDNFDNRNRWKASGVITAATFYVIEIAGLRQGFVMFWA